MKKRTLENSSVAAIDGVIALAVVVVCLIPYQHLLADLSNRHNRSISFADAGFGVAFVLGWRYCFSALKLYSRFSTVPSRMTAIAKGVCLMTAPVVAYVAAFHPADLTRRSIITLMLALFAFEVDRIFITNYLLDRLARRDPRRAIILGSGRRAGKAWREIRTRYNSSMTVLGFVDDRDPAEMAPEVARLYLGRLDELSDTILNKVVDVILIAMPIKSCYPQMQRAVDIAESVGVGVIYLEDIYSTSRATRYGDEDMFTELVPAQDHYLMQHLVKRILDIVCASVGLLVLSPVMLMIALAIKLTSDGPVIFSQQRYGYRRRLFSMCKFRTMIDGAEGMLASLEHVNEADGPIFKMKNDPRVTPIGRFLRSTSLDELPQLWNVLRGDMSMVGPRPMSVRDVSLFSNATLMRRFSVKAGITGLWQVSGRSHVGFDEWIELDVRYIETWSLKMDLSIMFRTIGAVLKRSGAM